MATINITTSVEERDKVLSVIKKHEGETLTMSAIAKEARINPNRVRYILQDLLDQGHIRKELTKFFNERYKRFAYFVES